MPGLRLEKACRGIVCGIDEAGRGPLAGPVLAAAVVLDVERMPRRLRRGLNDSKLLSPEERRDYYEALKGCARIGIGAASVREIDRINILRATLAAMARAVDALDIEPETALVDGNVPPQLGCTVQTVIGGDGLSLSIAAASVVAKVTRDAIMADLAPRYAGYGWEHNVGYGTPEHQAAMRALGVTPHHRRSFAPVRQVLGLDSNDATQVTDSLND